MGPGLGEAHQEHRQSRLAEHGLGYRAEHESRQAAPPVSGHRDEIGSRVVGALDDLGRGIAPTHVGAGSHEGTNARVYM